MKLPERVASDEDDDDADEDSGWLVSSALEMLLVSLIVADAAQTVARMDACDKKMRPLCLLSIEIIIHIS